MLPLRVFIGFDSRETIAYHVLSQSILSRSGKPVAITPLCRDNLVDVYKRPRGELESTDFSLTRFLVPYLSGYDGWSLFMDCDMLVLDDIAKLFECADERYAVMVVKHQHVPVERTKFLGAVQTVYEKKNWSSVMLFNNKLCPVLTPTHVNTANGLDLHQFKWLGAENQVGDLDARWNRLVDVQPDSDDVGVLHYTLGTPCFGKYANCTRAGQWYEERGAMMAYDRVNEFK